jgi:hypothetical protein
MFPCLNPFLFEGLTAKSIKLVPSGEQIIIAQAVISSLDCLIELEITRR